MEFILFYFILFCFVLFCFVLFYLIWCLSAPFLFFCNVFLVMAIANVCCPGQPFILNLAVIHRSKKMAECPFYHNALRTENTLKTKSAVMILQLVEKKRLQ